MTPPSLDLLLLEEKRKEMDELRKNCKSTGRLDESRFHELNPVLGEHAQTTQTPTLQMKRKNVISLNGIHNRNEHSLQLSQFKEVHLNNNNGVIKVNYKEKSSTIAQ